MLSESATTRLDLPFSDLEKVATGVAAALAAIEGEAAGEKPLS